MEPEPAFQTDRLPALSEYIKREGMLLKTEALEVVDALHLARKLLRDAEDNGCARVHLADWQKNIEPLVRICNTEAIYEMTLERARMVLTAENSLLSTMLLQLIKERSATSVTEAV